MKTISIADAQASFRELLDRVRAGEHVVITDEGHPVAMIGPVSAALDSSVRFRRLRNGGLIRLGTGAPPIELMRTPPPRLKDGSSAVEAVLEERRSGR